jgi:hypothetical protein
MLPVVLFAAAVSALPHLDIERVCRGGNIADDEYKTCLGSEQSARSTLEQKWAQYPARIRNECAHVVRVAPESSYAELQTCIESQDGEREKSGAAGQ